MQQPERGTTGASPAQHQALQLRPRDHSGPLPIDRAIGATLSETHLERAKRVLGPRAPLSKLRRLAQGTDIVQLLQRGDDRNYLGELATERTLARRWVDQIDADLAAHAAHLDADVHHQLSSASQNLRQVIDQVDGSIGARMALVGVFLALAAYPVALTMLADPQERRSFALLLASTTKSATVVLGEVARATTSMSTVTDVAKNRLWANIEQALLLTPHATRTELGKALSESTAYNVGIIFASFALLVAAFWGPQLVRGMVKGVRNQVHGKPTPATDPGTLDMLRRHRTTGRVLHEQITDFTSAFRDADGIITRGANAKKSDILSAMEDITKLFAQAAGDPHQKLPNKDFVPKAIGSAAAIAINTAAIMTFLGEDIAVADMAADDVFTACFLSGITMDPNKDAHDVSKGFQDWVALSAWLIPTMSINAALRNPIANDTRAFSAYSVVLPLGNLVFSAWIGRGLSAAIGWGFEKFRSGDAAGGQRAIQEAAAFARRMVEVGLLDPAALGEEPTPDQQRLLDSMHRAIGMTSIEAGVPQEQRVVELDDEGRPIPVSGAAPS
ncbi:hypothetical protein DZC73_11210 [Albitalea terrae]|uniref:Uncharacterized protein n=2 Tax=Piscinibacter terrae TaxID=2496871 RepID=A0A3N7HUA1_9BURK|nr:hypothetical protein DZC73_11210 [Albitalea terrae]